MYVVVFYDISSNRVRQLVADKLLSKGLVRVQRSVFIGRGGYALAKDLARYLTRFINPGDSLLIMVVSRDSVMGMIRLGDSVSLDEQRVKLL